ncbi:hypothetical protein PRIPAC_82727 [Pristionchus pacificus]|uniref:glucuronosyltransferase n=1 Tax=Pristionchus pacificus TaxID=54126 RepID=A0A2A6C3M9_PRIPA|nr:hypothetical protein PRIPAC_82727 [Pristionchus pacificus]|eukprot:PDM72726.1 Glycosyltransferase [Pristionchus pacificus]
MSDCALFAFVNEYPIFPVVILVCNIVAFVPFFSLLYIAQIAPLHNNCRYILCVWTMSFGVVYLLNIGSAILNFQNETGYMPLNMFDPKIRFLLYQVHVMSTTFCSTFEIALSIERIVAITYPRRYHFSDTAWNYLLELFARVKEAYEMSRAMIPAYATSFLLKLTCTILSTIIAASVFFALRDDHGYFLGYLEAYYFIMNAGNGSFALSILLLKHTQLRKQTLRKFRSIFGMKSPHKRNKYAQNEMDINYSSAIKFLVYNPLFGRSHVNFMGKISDVLVDAGHEVVMIAPVIDYNVPNVGSTKVQKVIKIPPSLFSIRYSEIAADEASSNLWRGKTFPSALEAIKLLYKVWVDQCNATLNHPGLLDSLKEEKFDAAFSEPMDKCGYGIFHHLGIKNIAATLSIAAFEGSFDLTGLPSFPSYVPVGNTLSLGFGKVFIPMMSQGVELLLKERFGNDFPDMNELLSETSLWFMNNEPLIEFPRPMIHKIIDIGGISVSTGYSQLNKTWSDILDLRPQTVLLSFGTVAKSFLMPENYKSTIREVKFPDVTFIWKYEKPEDKISDGIPNLIETTWVPQNDMLYDPRLSLFITHCGQGSATEATTAGIPLIVIPVLADQNRNAATGIVLEKEALEHQDELETTIKEALTNNMYRDNARAVGEMIRNRPFSPRETFVQNMEFLARYGPLRMLDHYGKELNFFQYYLVDVTAFILAVLTVLLIVVFKLAKFVLSVFFRSAKTKRD